MTEAAPLGWERFRIGLAEIAQVEAESLQPAQRLVEDLGIDSIALAEVVVFLSVDLGMTSVDESLSERDWSNTTIGELFEEYRSGTYKARTGLRFARAKER